MKLPEDFERNDDMAYLKHNYPLTFEAIVRDCARLAIVYGDNGDHNESGHAIAYEILARYGLEVKP